MLAGCVTDAIVGITSDAGVDAPPSRFALRATLTAQGNSNAAAPDGFATAAFFTLTLDGRPMEGASVLVRTPFAETTLDATGPGTYAGRLSVWSAAVTVRVERDGVTWLERQFQGIQAHRFSGVTNEMPIERAAPFTVRWSPSGAPEAWLASPGPLRLLPDNGSFVLSPELIASAMDNKDLVLRVVRAETQAIPDLALGSSIRFECANEIEFHVMP